MAYILPVNSGMLAKTGMPLGGVFFATAVAAAIATLVMALFANLPIALAPGMGLNAFFTYTLVNFGDGPLSWKAALAAVLVSGILFFIVSVTGLRKIVINSIPKGLKLAVGAGIGFFITFIGLKNAGLIVSNPATLVQLGDLSHPTVLLGVFGIILVIVLYSMGNRFSLIIAIFVTAIVGYLMGLIFPDAFTIIASKPIFGSDPIKLIPLSAISGAGFLVFADIISRYLTGPGTQLYLGILTSLIGVPFFLYLAIKETKV